MRQLSGVGAGTVEWLDEPVTTSVVDWDDARDARDAYRTDAITLVVQRAG